MEVLDETVITEDGAGLEASPEELPPLPFRYERTRDLAHAMYSEPRVSRVKFSGIENEPKSDEELVEFIRAQYERRRWFTVEYWRLKGRPQEQIEFRVGDKDITVYNFSKEKQFTDEHIEKTILALQTMSAHFPQALDQLRWILVDDVQQPSILGDDDLFPTNGYALPEQSAFKYTPRGMELSPYRINKVTNFEGVFVHEMGHLIQEEFREEWNKEFQWELCGDHEDKFELKETPLGHKKWFDKQTGRMWPQSRFPLQPEQCVTEYGMQAWHEDVSESLVAYIYDPELLKTVSAKKYEIISQHDVKRPQQIARVLRVSPDQIRLPQIEPETIHYYIQESGE